MSGKVFFLFLFSLVTFLLVIPPLSYSKSSTILGSEWTDIYGGTQWTWEKRTMKQLADYITNCSLASDYTTYNMYGAQTTADNIYDAAYGQGDIPAVSFYIGHAKADEWTHYYPFWPFGEHTHFQYYITANTGSKVYDEDIYSHTLCQNGKFAFLWACHQGNETGEMITYPCGQERARGMPFAWLHTNSLSSDGYTYPDDQGLTFIGFNGRAPWLTRTRLTGRAGYYFACHFYHYAMISENSIKMALDHAAFETWAVSDFSQSIFYTGYTDENGNTERMVVYGDGNLEIGTAPEGGIPPVLPPPPAPPGGGPYCPFVYAWDGTNFALDNNILPRAELSNGADVEDHYRLEQTPVPKSGKYSLLLSEFESEHSYFDQVQLFAVDHSQDVRIAFTPTGELLTYKNPVPPISAIDDDGASRLNEISLIDGNVSDPATYFQGYPDDYLALNFGQVNSNNAKLIVRDDMKKMEECILVQVKDGNDAWQTVETLVPRAYWSVEAVNLSPYVVQGQNLWVRLYWKYPHRLDFVGLDTAPQDDYEIRYGNLVSATHSTQGNVKPLLLYSDSLYAELIPGQQIQMEFTLPNNTRPARTYVFYTKGHYYTIP